MRKIGLHLLPILLVISCDRKIDFATVVPERVDNFATEFITDIKEMKIEESMLKVKPEMNTQAGRVYLMNTYSNIQSWQIDSLRIVNAKKQTYQGDKEYSNYIIEYESPTKGKYLYLGVSVYEEGNMLLISAFDAKVSETSLAEIHAFSFAKREFAHYLFIAFAILVPLFIITTLAFAIRTRLSRKWLWIVAILFGFVKFTINWTTGQLGFQMIGFQLLGAGLSRQGLVGPWTLSFTIPVMAIYFWIKRYWDNRDSELMLRYNERQKVTT